MFRLPTSRHRKKRFVWPFSKQHRHLRSMQKAGKAAKFGSFKYSAADLYEKRESPIPCLTAFV